MGLLIAFGTIDLGQFWPSGESDGVKLIRFHDCRHTHASILLSEGADLLAVADRLGHSLQTLMTTYRHVLDRRKDRTADRAEAIFGVPQ